MDFEYVIFWAVAAFVLSIWLMMLNQWGHVDLVSEEGFVFKPFLGKAIVLTWSDLRGPFRIHKDFMPHMTIGLASAGFTSLRPSLAVLLRFNQQDQALVDQM